jgi:hypothetical protein
LAESLSRNNGHRCFHDSLAPVNFLHWRVEASVIMPCSGPVAKYVLRSVEDPFRWVLRLGVRLGTRLVQNTDGTTRRTWVPVGMPKISPLLSDGVFFLFGRNRKSGAIEGPRGTVTTKCQCWQSRRRAKSEHIDPAFPRRAWLAELRAQGCNGCARVVSQVACDSSRDACAGTVSV